MSNLIKIDKEYAAWIKNLSQRFRQSQIKASVKVNNEVLGFYWSLGKDIVDMKAEAKWGKGFMKTLSMDLKDAIPGVQGFSPTNLYYMEWFYLLYYKAVEILPQVG